MIHWIILHLLSLLTVKGAILAATVGLSDLGTSTAEEAGTGETATETDTETTEVADDGTGTEETQEGESQEEKEDKEDTKVDWRTVPGQVKTHLQEISKTNPTLANLLQNAVYTSQSMLREFPGGIKEVRALKTSIEELGGVEEAKIMRTEYNQFVEQQEALDQKAASGDPSVLDELVNISGDGFGKLMPVAMDRWASKDPAGYNHVIGKVIVSALQEGGVVADLNLAFKMLGLKNEQATAVAMESLQKVATWANDINKVALKVPEKPAIDPKIAEQQKTLDDEKTQIFNDKFSNQFGSWRNNRIKEEALRVIPKGKTLTDVQMRTLGNNVVNEIRSILTADQDYMKSLEKLYQSRNMDELQKFTRSRTDKLLQKTVSKVYRQLFSNFTPGKKTVVKPEEQVAKPNEKTTTTGTTTVVKGWKQVAPDKAPSPQEIDSNKTSFEMKFAKQAILKNGEKVYWGPKVPK